MGQAVRLCHRSELAEGSARGFDPQVSGRDTLFISHRAKRGYKISHCEKISFKTIGH